MESTEEKAQSFIQRLLSNPSIRHYEILRREDQVFRFIISSQSSLYPLLSSSRFFPGKTWEQITSILFDALSVVVKNTISSEVSAVLSTIDFSFVSYLKRTNYPVSKCRDQVFDFLSRLLSGNEARKAFGGPFTAVKAGIADRYMDQVFVRREYVQFELVKVQKLKMGAEEIKNMVKASLLLKPSIHLLTADDSLSGRGTTSDIIRKQFADKSFRVLVGRLALLPQELVRCAVDSNLSFMDNPNQEAVSRIVAVFAARCRNYASFDRIERGAEHPDKSWFNIARKNYKYYGFDIKMIDEFYRIATENGW